MLHYRYHIAWRRSRHELKVLALSAALFAGMPLVMREPMPSALIRLTGNMEMDCQLIIAECTGGHPFAPACAQNFHCLHLGLRDHGLLVATRCAVLVSQWDAPAIRPRRVQAYALPR